MPGALHLLGVPTHRRAPAPEAVPPGRALILVAYLAYHERWFSRRVLADLFWPEGTEKAARHSLNQLLYSCRSEPWTDGLAVERSRLRYAAETDLARFRGAVAQGAWREALQHYGGEFLSSIALELPPSLEAWLTEARRELRAAWHQAASARSQELVVDGDAAAAADLLAALVESDEFAEEALQRLLRCSFDLDAARVRRALRLYERSADALRDELDAQPHPETRALADALARRVAAPRAPTLRNFPEFAEPFVGRAHERRELDALLGRSDVRLVTLLGPGGIGKTRLAAHVAAAWADRSPDGAVYVPLAQLDDAERAATTLLGALGAPSAPDRDPQTQAIDHLRTRSALLVFDNFESVLGAAGLVQDLLDASPGSRVVATSREALGLPGEHLFDVPGLHVSGDAEAISERDDAVRLFARAARRFQPEFELDAAARPAVFALCRLVGGSPLGLELAATWMRILTVGEVVDEIRGDLGFLAPEADAAPDRRGGLRAVFDASWRLLSDEERSVLARLSVFRGGFDRAAARAIADASARTLLSLVNKSLLQRTRGGRFEIHATIQAFSAAELPPRDEALARERLVAYVAELARRFRNAVNGPDEADGVARMRTDLGNVRAALAYARDAGDPETALRVAVDLRQFWYYAGLVSEAGRRLDDLLARLAAAPAEVDPQLLGWGYEAAGELRRLSGDAATARAAFERSLELFAKADDEASRVHAFNGLGIAAYLDGDPAAARRAWEEGLELAQRRDDENAEANLSNSLGFLAKDDGDHRRMTELFERALAVYQRMGHRFGILSATSNLGYAALHLEDYAGSLRLQREALAMALELDHGDSLLRCLEDLAALAAACARPADAVRLAATAAASRVALELPIEPHDREELERYLAPARVALDAEALERARRGGETADLREAARAALELELSPPERS